jgi:uncharacterized Zn finger protein
MTSPVTKIEVECPRCASVYEDWYRASINLNLDDFDDEYLREAATATCPTCGHVIDLDTLVVEHGRLALEDRDSARTEPTERDVEARSSNRLPAGCSSRGPAQRP